VLSIFWKNILNNRQRYFKIYAELFCASTEKLGGKMKKYLLVIDVQNDFVNGALGTAEAMEIIPRVKEKIAEYKNFGGCVIFTRDTHGEDYLSTNEGKNLPVRHCIKGSYGWEIYPDVYVEGAEIIDKPSFGFTEWEKYIKADEEGLSIELIGLCTDICVISNALILKAKFPEADVSIDSTACAGVTPKTHEAALETMKMCQVRI
jgi:nicotinamidase-related amidase